MLVTKRSGKPFKNKLLVAYVKGEGIHPVTNQPTYILEDDSYIEQRNVKDAGSDFYTCGRYLMNSVKPR